jgi:hypothetical protein
MLHMQHRVVRARALNTKTEELLDFLLWSAEVLTQPAFRNLTDSHDSRAYRNGLLKQVCWSATPLPRSTGSATQL